MARVRVGTSGYNYPHWRGKFYPADLPSQAWLEYYATRFDTVELNVTFYRLPLEKTFVNWFWATPPGFAFALKGSRLITHLKRLEGIEEEVGRFFSRAGRLEEKLAVVLWQLPPGLHADPTRLEAFCRILQKDRTASTARHAFEFRHRSWFTQPIYDLLRAYNCALCIADSPRWPQAEEITADFTYLRFHGAERLYSSCYTAEQLSSWAEKIKAWLAAGLDVYAYFNNDAQGHALGNAADLRGLVS